MNPMHTSRFPQTIRAGDSFQWRLPTSDYAASDGWAASLRLVPQSGTTPVTVTGTYEDGAWQFSAKSSETSVWVLGAYTVVIFVTSSDSRITLQTSATKILPDLATASSADTRSFARQMLDAIEAALLNRATKDQLDMIEITVYSRTQKRGESALIAARNKFQIEVNREEVAAGRRSSRIFVRF